MTRGVRWLLGLVVALCVAGGGLYLWLAQNSFRVTISKAQLQERIDARMPFTGTRGPLQYTVMRAAIDLRANGRVGIDADFSARILGTDVGAALVGSGVLDYREGEFFLREVGVEDVAILPGPQRESGSRLRQILGANARGVLSVAQKQIEDEIRRHGGAILGAVLERYPVYKLKPENVKHELARLVLEKIEVQDQSLVVTLNPLKGK